MLKMGRFGWFHITSIEAKSLKQAIEIITGRGVLYKTIIKNKTQIRICSIRVVGYIPKGTLCI